MITLSNLNDLLFEARMNMEYHSQRFRYLRQWVRLEKVLLLTSSTASVYFARDAILKNYELAWLPNVLSAIAAFLTIVLIVSDADEQCSEHKSLYTKWSRVFAKLQKFVHEEKLGDPKYSEILDEHAEVSAEQPPSPNLSVLIYAQNVAFRELGYSKRIEQNWFRRLLRNVYDGDADNHSPKITDQKS